MSAPRGTALRELISQLSALAAQGDAVQRAIRAALGSAASCGDPSAAAFSTPSPPSAFSCPLGCCPLSHLLTCAPSQAGATARQPATLVCCHGQWHWGGMWLGCQEWPNRLHSLHSPPPSAVMGPPPGAARAALLPRPTFLTLPSRRAPPRPRPLPVRPTRSVTGTLRLQPTGRVAVSRAGFIGHGSRHAVRSNSHCRSPP